MEISIAEHSLKKLTARLAMVKVKRNKSEEVAFICVEKKNKI